jgi:protein-S-isoprenylcysteine O-methyltransferase Ste14
MIHRSGEGAAITIILRAMTYAALFVGLVLIFVPARLLSWSGIVRPATFGLPQIAGVVIGSVGAAMAAWCVYTFAVVGRGTPAPFDPPRRLVVRRPYRFVRNPMYIGAGLALIGVALVYESVPFLLYTLLFALIAHIFVLRYEEPTLRRTFGEEYESYRSQTGRWWPKWR